MKFGEAITSGFKNYVLFEGRARRSAFWFWMLFTSLVSIVISILFSFDTNTYSMISGLWSLAVLLPTLGLGIRRLHDTNRSGWFWLMGLIPLVGGIILIVFWAQDSNAGDNRFGANPKGA